MGTKSGTKRRTGTGRQRLSPTPAMIDAAAMHRAHRIAEAFAGDESVLLGGDELIVKAGDQERMEAIRLAVSALNLLSTGEIQLVAATIIHEYGLLKSDAGDRLHGMIRP